MIISVERVKQIVNLDGWSDAKIEMKLTAIEQTIRAYTNNNFQIPTCRKTADIIGGLFEVGTSPPFEVGDTIQVSESALNSGLYVVSSMYDGAFAVETDVKDEFDVLVTKVYYPADVVDCVVNLLDWEVRYRDKVGVQSETLSRHSVTYFNQDAGNQVNGYPVSLLGCLKPYKKVRF